MPPESMRLTLIFDGDCGFCTLAAGLIATLDRAKRVDALPFQRRGVPEAAGLSRRQCVEATRAITSDGRRYRGAAAVHAAVAYAIGKPALFLLYRIGPIRLVEDAIYALIARLRPWLPGITPYCRRLPHDCRGR